MCSLGHMAVIGDLGPDTDWSDGLFGVDTVVHLANRVHVMQARDPLAEIDCYHQVNVEGTRRLAQSAAAIGVRKFIFVSSVKALGERGVFDATTMASPEDAYGRSKLAAENILMEIADRSGMRAVILCPPLIYGPGVGANFLRLLSLVDRGIPLPLAAVNNRRSLLYVGNLVSVIARCLEMETSSNGRYCISDGAAVSTPELIRVMAQALDRSCRFWFIPLPVLLTLAGFLGKQQEIRRLTDSLVVDDAPFRNAFCWEPPYSMRDGLLATAQWYRSCP
ncbi:UDP-glucose 4-epimerase [Georgfuchsia toluolica]|uniref:UDP-glucose 4-epimerase n=1 Tax=Georgfuchsia toluolica TaxID=424218 RepID=A0A916J539_9PROT|nr:UDP-glucose 4-epimerase [Georgfuchsia toluolica]